MLKIYKVLFAPVLRAAVLAATCAVVFVTCASSASALSFTWGFGNAILSDDSRAFGVFSTDPTTGFLTTFDITTTNEAASVVHGNGYSTTGFSPAEVVNVTSNSFTLRRASGLDFFTVLHLSFLGELTERFYSPSGYNLLNLALSYELECSTANPASCFSRSFVTGSAVAPVPIPPALPLFATIVAGGGLIAWRRKRKAGARAA